MIRYCKIGFLFRTSSFAALVVFNLLIGHLNAQQLPQYSQYDFNKFLVNPAVAGSESYIDLLFDHRSQWVGFEGAPNTQTFSGHALLPNGKMGVGLSFFNDATGPSKVTGVGLVYAYHLQMNDVFLSFGLNGSYYQHVIDGGQITLSQQSDKAIDNGINHSGFPDAGFGAYLYNSRFYLGLSALHLIENDIRPFKKTAEGLIPLKRHFYMIGGYRYDVSEDFAIEPSVFAEYVAANPFQFDMHLRAHFLGYLFGKVGYRSNDALVFGGGLYFKEQLLVGYTYDIITTPLNNTNSGSHEVTIGYKIKLGYFKSGDPRPKKRYNLKLRKR